MNKILLFRIKGFRYVNAIQNDVCYIFNFLTVDLCRELKRLVVGRAGTESSLGPCHFLNTWSCYLRVNDQQRVGVYVRVYVCM